MPVRFEVGRDGFAEAVAWAARGVAARPPVAALGGILLDVAAGQVRLSGLDHEVSHEAWLPVDAAAPGRALVSGRLLAEIARSLPPGPVEVSTDGDRARVRSDAVRFGLPLMPADDHPVAPPMPPAVGRVAGDQFAAAVAQVAAATARDETLPVLTGVHVSLTGRSVVLAATDRYRLAVRELPWEPEHPGVSGAVLVPARMLADTARALSTAAQVTLALAGDGEGVVGVRAGDLQATGRILDVPFPRHESRWPDTFTATVDVDSAALVTAVRRVCLVGGPRGPVELSAMDGRLRVSAGGDAAGDAEEEVAATLGGPPLRVGFNSGYLLDGVRGADSPTVRLWLTAPGRPAAVTAAPCPGHPRQAGYRYLVMSLQAS